MRTSLIILSVLAVAGCGAGAKAANSTSTAASASPGQSSSTQQVPPVTSGLLAALSGHTLQVQSATSQTAVTYSASTRFTDTVPARATDVVVGSCVQVRSAPPAGDAPTPAPTGPLTAVTATSVTLSSAVNGTCPGPGGPGRQGGGRFNGTGGPGSTPPPGFPGGRGRRFGGGASGLVTAVHGATFTVASTRFGQPGGTATTPVTVTTTASTTYNRSAPATPAALKVGLCVTARGQADSTGTVAATLIALRPAENGTCANGFGGGRGA